MLLFFLNAMALYKNPMEFIKKYYGIIIYLFQFGKAILFKFAHIDHFKIL